MKNIYLLGECSFEIVAVRTLLLSEKYSIHEGMPLCSVRDDDIFILCVSSSNLLAWGRYLMYARCLVELYDCNVIVLTPSHCPRFFIDQRVHFINGRRSIDKLNKELLALIKTRRSSDKVQYMNDMVFKVLEDVIKNIPLSLIARRDSISYKKVLSVRLKVCHNLGFSSNRSFLLFFAGTDINIARVICGLTLHRGLMVRNLEMYFKNFLTMSSDA